MIWRPLYLYLRRTNVDHAGSLVLKLDINEDLSFLDSRINLLDNLARYTANEVPSVCRHVARLLPKQ